MIKHAFRYKTAVFLVYHGLLVLSTTSLLSFSLPFNLKIKNPFITYVEEVVRKDYTVSPTVTIELINSMGDVTITSWKNNKVECKAIKTGPEEEVKATLINVTAHKDKISFKTVPDSETSRVSVEYRLMVPLHSTLACITTQKGTIKIKYIEGPITASTQERGSIEIRGSTGTVIAQAAESIKVKQLELPATATLLLQASTGNIELALPAQLNATLKASAPKGIITTEQDITFELLRLQLNEPNIKRYLHEVKALLGNGGMPQITITAAKGNIILTEH